MRRSFRILAVSVFLVLACGSSRLEPSTERGGTTTPIVTPTPASPTPVVAQPSAEEHLCLQRARAHATTLARTLTAEEEAQGVLVMVEPGATFSPTLLGDLDGDGQRDLDLTPSGGLWNKVWPHLLYGSSDCAYLGDVVDADLRVEDTMTEGHHDITATSSESCAGNWWVRSRYTWNGQRYQQVDKLSCCHCGDECPRPNPARCAEFNEYGTPL